MDIRSTLGATLFGLTLFSGAAHADDHGEAVVKIQPYRPGIAMTRSVQAGITPEQAIEILKAGNKRMVSGRPVSRNTRQLIAQTALGQYPFASVVGCIDSRAAPEIVFDQGIGDLFVARVAGNTVNDDILGSLEYAAKVAGSRLIVVMGHTGCGAIKGACDGVKMGNLTTLLGKFTPAVEAVQTTGERNSKNHEFVAEVTEMNVQLVVKAIRQRSSILAELESAGKIKIVGALYSTSNGKVTWYE